MKSVGHGLRFENANRLRQGTIQRAMEVLSRNRRLHREARYLPQSVPAGVGPSRSLRQRSLADNAFESLLKLALNGPFVRLHLPAVEVCAVVRQGQLPRRRSGGFVNVVGHRNLCW